MGENNLMPVPRAAFVWADRLVALLAVPMVLLCLVVLASTVLPGWPLVAPAAFRRVVGWAFAALFALVVVSELAARAGTGLGWRQLMTRRPSAWPWLWRAARRALAAPRRHLGQIALAVLVAVLLGVGATGANKAKGLASDPNTGTFTRYDPDSDRIVPITAERYLRLQRQGQRGDAALFALMFLIPAAVTLGRSRTPAASGGPGAAPATG